MRKISNFNVGDKVFAKVKGYPPWPARIIAESGKKYNVKFYGTGETGVIKLEDISYYLKNKEKFQKPLKRKDYVDAFEQIEAAIKEDGGDGDSSSTGADDSFSSESNISVNTSNSSINSSAKGIKKGIKRKRSVSDKSVADQQAQSPKKKTSKAEEVESGDMSNEEPATPTKKSPKGNRPSEAEKSKGFEFVPINDVEGLLDRDGFEIIETEDVKEKSEALDFNIQIVSEKALKNNIAYANHVKEKKSIYKGRPVEPREDYISQVLPVKLPTGIMGGIKLHKEWPLKFDNEYDRAIYDELVAVRVLEEKQKIDSGNMSILNNPQLFIPNIEMTINSVQECLYLRDIHSKRTRIDRLKTEADLMGIDSKIKLALGLDKADPTQAITYLETMCMLNFDELMLKKHPHVVDMVRRLRKYVGNTKEWNLSEESLSEFIVHAEKIRATAENVYAKFKKVVKIPESSGSFWDGFTDILAKFRDECKDITEAHMYLLCAEPMSRRAFLDQLEEMETEKENSSGVANSETAPVVMNGDCEKPTVES